MHDCKKKDIYESDIINILYKGKPYHTDWINKEIIFYQGGFGFFSTVRNITNFVAICTLDLEILQIQIVGNKFKNPELLKK